MNMEADTVPISKARSFCGGHLWFHVRFGECIMLGFRVVGWNSYGMDYSVFFGGHTGAPELLLEKSRLGF